MLGRQIFVKFVLPCWLTRCQLYSKGPKSASVDSKLSSHAPQAQQALLMCGCSHVHEPRPEHSLYLYDEAPVYLRENHYIRSGYRFVVASISSSLELYLTHSLTHSHFLCVSLFSTFLVSSGSTRIFTCVAFQECCRTPIPHLTGAMSPSGACS